MSKITAYGAASALDASDVLPIVDVSDTAMASTGTTKKVTVSDLSTAVASVAGLASTASVAVVSSAASDAAADAAAVAADLADHTADTAGHVPTITQIALGTSYTPSQLTMHAVHSERSRDPLPSSGPSVPLVEQFLNASTFTTRYLVVGTANAPASETVDNGTFTMVSSASAGGSNHTYRARTKLAAPVGVFTALRVDPGWTSGASNSTAACGFYTSTGSGDYVQALWNLDTGAITVDAKGGTGNIIVSATTGTPDTIAGPTTAPAWIGLILAWPVATLVTSTDGENWNVQAIYTLTRTTGLTDETAWGTFRPGFRLAAVTPSKQVVVSGFRAGYVGVFGHLNHRPILFADGTPLRRDGKYFMTITVPHSNSGFLGQHSAIVSFDPDSYQIELVGHLMARWGGLVGSISANTIVYEPSTAKWHVLGSTWGFTDQSTGVDIVYATTHRDLLSPGVHLLNYSTVTVTGGGGVSFYDNAQRQLADGTWVVPAITTATRTGWSGSQHYACLLTGPTLDNLTLQTTDTSEAADGVHWFKCGGTWYIVGGGTSGFLQWSSSLTSKTSLSSWDTDGLLSFGSFPAHPSPLVVDDGYRTRYLMVCYDGSLVLGLNGTRGGMLVQEADEKPTGQEFAPVLHPRYIGA